MEINYLRLAPSCRNKFTKPQRRVIYVLIGLLVFCSVLHILVGFSIPFYSNALTRLYYWAHPEKDVGCHAITGKSSLPDISDISPRKGRSIFFHETSCSSYLNGKIVINARQACAVESAAKMNPDREVYLLYASPGTLKNENTESDRILNVLTNYSNVNILHVDLPRYLNNTPLENLWNSGRIRLSQYSQPHTSDVLRYLTLYKYGGIYLDLDVIVIKSLSDLGANYAGVESDTDVAAGILGFGATPPGSRFAEMAVQDLALHFRGDHWGWNGPGTITRLIREICKEDSIKKIIGKRCHTFKVYPTSEFYAVSYKTWQYFCSTDALDTVLNMTKNSHIIHVWNQFTSSCKIPLSSNVPYLYFAKKFCPNVVSVLSDYF